MIYVDTAYVPATTAHSLIARSCARTVPDIVLSYGENLRTMKSKPEKQVVRTREHADLTNMILANTSSPRRQHRCTG